MNINCPVHGYLLQHTSGENHSASFFELCQCSASHQPIERSWVSTEDFVYSQPQPYFPAPSSPIHWQSTVTPPITTKVNRWQCFICPETFPRRQERERHGLMHVPYFLHCPLLHCAWRGNRANIFKKHWQQEDHRPYHQHYGHVPGRTQIETYDPWAVLNQIKSGAISLSDGEDRAIVLVQVKAYELQKTNVWMDAWGRSKKRA